MALEASDRLIDNIWVNWRCTCGCISRPTFKRSASLLDIMGKLKEISQDFRKIIVDLHKSGSSLGAISKCLMVSHSSVSTIACKYKHHHTAQEGDTFCLLDMNKLWCEKCKSIPEQQQRTLWRCWRKRVLYRHNLKGRSARKKPLLQNRQKRPDYGLQLHVGIKIVLFVEMSSGLMKQI